MTNTITNYWCSGDWRRVNNNKPPYNGIKIKATANYKNNKLDNIIAVVTDFTKDPNGVPSTVELSEINEWAAILIPEKNGQPNTDFTVMGTHGSFGMLKLDRMSNGILLRVAFRYGINNFREELGFIMQFNETIEM
ncbi:hypothetical protein EV195_10270 [Tenacibaculum skagerrakense]|uniref:Uncharacterized protein n=1 Tax=Tenacibaculum skagerrakense TaxID=186571 RepID=A0A4R2NXG4_9FLAO|nr:hypothetical protein [Tenacibaculum skagerrakense]TCP26732.1 hypothetical protein EV195_10270 [Tenacibaculum skagerrakense]